MSLATHGESGATDPRSRSPSHMPDGGSRAVLWCPAQRRRPSTSRSSGRARGCVRPRSPRHLPGRSDVIRPVRGSCSSAGSGAPGGRSQTPSSEVTRPRPRENFTLCDGGLREGGHRCQRYRGEESSRPPDFSRGSFGPRDWSSGSWGPTASASQHSRLDFNKPRRESSDAPRDFTWDRESCLPHGVLSAEDPPTQARRMTARAHIRQPRSRGSRTSG